MISSRISSRIYSPIYRALLLVIFIFITSPFVHAQNRDEWSAFSALNVAQSVAFASDGTLWVATTGGVVGYNPATDSTQVFRTTEGLLSLNCSAIAIDSVSGDMYIGGVDGSISIRKRSGEWAYCSVMASATQFPDRRVNSFGFRDGMVFILTTFGGGVYNPADSTLRDNFSNLRVSVNAITFWHDTIWLATDHGLRSTNKQNLADPANWDQAETDRNVLSLTVFNDRLLLGTTDGAYAWDGQNEGRRFDLPGGPIRFASRAGGVIAASTDQLFRDSAGSFVPVAIAPKPMQAVAVSNVGGIGVGLVANGFGYVEGDTVIIKLPNAPPSNTFNDIALDAQGSIWVAHSSPPQPGPASRLKEGLWRSYTEANTGMRGMDNSWKISAGANGTIWAGSNGGAVNRFRLVDTGIEIIHYDRTNSPIRGIGSPEDTGFQKVAAAQGDQNGRTWLINYDNTMKNPGGSVLLAQLRPDEGDGERNGFVTFHSPIATDHGYQYLAIDDNGTKWLGTGTNNLAAGLLFIHDRGTLSDKTDDTSELLTVDDGLLNNTQTALAVDADGLLWIGTPTGLTVLVNPTSVVNSQQRADFRTIRSLANVGITAIAVDALNRKWIGTADQGVYLLSIDGSEILAHYATDNSPLVNNHVNSILAVNATGAIYIGTANGLSKISTVAIEPSTDPGIIFVSPQPFLLPPSEPLRLAGLPENAMVKILSLTRSLIRDVPTPGGGVAYWDGTDQAGVFVPSGVDLIAAESGVGDATVVGKVAVIKR